MAAKLRAVKEGEAAPARRRTPTIAQAAASGSERELLVALRKRLATAVQDPKCPPAPLAALSRQLLEIRDKIEAFDAELERTKEGGSDGAVVADDGFDAAAI